MRHFIRGSSLVELIIALAILLIASLMMYRTFFSNVRHLERERRLTIANTFLNSSFEAMRAAPFESLYPIKYEQPIDSYYLPNGIIKVHIKKIDDDLLKVILVLEFNVTDKTRRTMKLESYRYRYGI